MQGLFPGLTFYAFPWGAVLPFVNGGAPGVAVAGGIDIPYLVTPGLAGFHVYHPALVLDPTTPSGASATNGLEIGGGTRPRRRSAAPAPRAALAARSSFVRTRTMNHRLWWPAAPLAALLLANALAAQMTITATAASELRVSVSSAATQTLPAGTSLTGQGLGTSAPCGGGGVSFAGLSVTLAPSATQPSASFVLDAVSPCLAFASASGSILVEVSSATPIAGSLQVDARSSGGAYSVDIGANGTFELTTTLPFFANRGELAVPLVVDATGVQVLVAADAAAATSPTFPVPGNAAVVVTFVPDGILVPEGTACGPDLAASYVSTSGFGATGDVFNLDATRSLVTPHAFFVFGVQSARAPIPPLGCALLTVPLAAAPVAVSAEGDASLRVSLPMTLGPVDLRAQYLAGMVQAGTGATLWQMSQAVRLRLP
ncbi:MAG: hypothetical protein AAF628_23015 [Planctomycetota bacterium]